MVLATSMTEKKVDDTDVEDNVIECELDNVVGNFLLHAPTLNDLVDFWSSLLGNLLDDGRVGWVEALETLFLNTRLKKLLITGYLGRTGLYLLKRCTGGWRAAVLRRLSWGAALTSCQHTFCNVFAFILFASMSVVR